LKDGINIETIFDFNVIELTAGQYGDRVIIPFYDETKETMVGFVAVDILGKKKYVRKRVVECLKRNKCEQLPYVELYQLVKKVKESYRKTLYCKGSNTGENLFGFHKLIGNGTTNRVILVEGERDVMKLQQEGFPAVGTHGTHLTQEQSELLRKYDVKEVIIAFDPDAPGQEASRRVYQDNYVDFDNMWELKLEVDPKYYNKETFSELLKKAKEEKGGGSSESARGMIKNEVSLKDRIKKKRFKR
jgi:hypothetical protein